jgi:uncharacterized LabA/DUF88 family protein
MIFVDGENLVFRYQSMVKRGWIPRTDDVCHIPDTLIWQSSFSQGVMLDEVIRASYYTYVVGDEQRVSEVEATIKKLSFSQNRNSTLPATLTPKVLKKNKQTAKGKGVEIAMVVDILNHVHSGHVDSVLLLTGDGDYLPLVREIQRSGSHCCISAFSDGLNRQLPVIADKFYCLDHTMFTAGGPQMP